jgi:hypothetical protein
MVGKQLAPKEVPQKWGCHRHIVATLNLHGISCLRPSRKSSTCEVNIRMLPLTRCGLLMNNLWYMGSCSSPDGNWPRVASLYTAAAWLPLTKP